MQIDYAAPTNVITSYSLNALGGMAGAVTATASSTWIGANIAMLIPFVVRNLWFMAEEMFICNGATTAGNVDVGIYSEDLKRIVSSGSVAQSGASALQTLGITDTMLSRGRYYMGAVSDSATATFYVTTFSPTPDSQALGLMGKTTLFPLADIGSPADGSMAKVVLMGIRGRSS